MLDEKKLSAEAAEKMVEYRRHFHMHPELSFKEFETSKFIRSHLEAAGLEIMPGIRGCSVVGILDSGRPGPTIAFRADIDALNLDEKNTDKPYCSQNPGAMHACGHDSHTAMSLCLAEAMAEHRGELRGKVKFIFQQGEERQPGGAVMLVEDGALKDVDYIIGAHVAPQYPVGSIASKAGDCSASVDDFQLFIHGKGAHGARPNLSHDPIMCGVSIAAELQQIVSRVVDPLKPLVITIGKFAGGYAPNIIPDDVEMMATIRTYDAGVRKLAEERIREIIDHACKMHQCTYDLTYEHGYPALITDERSVELLKKTADRLGWQYITHTASMGSEDFSYYLQVCDGCYFHVGSGDGVERFLHNPHFDIDEKCMVTGFECLLGMYNQLVFLENESDK